MSVTPEQPASEQLEARSRRLFPGLMPGRMRALAEVARLQASHPMCDAVVDEVAGRLIRVGDRWLADFASCNYLGFDLEQRIIDSVPGYLGTWGTHPSWARMIASPRLYEEIESELTALLGAQDALLFPTITHIHLSVIPALAAGGEVFVDMRAHQTIHDGCLMASARGATVRRVRATDPQRLDELLATATRYPRVVCVDGVNSMTGNPPPLPELAAVTRAHDALLYVDDGHGFGVIGERGPGELSPFGMRGNSVVRHTGESYDGIVLVGGFSKAYSSLLAFIACPSEVKDLLKVGAAPYTFSGPSPVASLATAQAGLRLNAERGDLIRAELYRKTARLLDGMAGLGIATPNESGFPIVEILLRDPGDVDAVGRLLFDRGIYVTLAPFPVVPRSQAGFRVQVTAANTDEEIDHLLAVLGEVADRFPLRGAPRPGENGADRNGADEDEGGGDGG